jgi:uncharacterized protein (DUF2249 family)
MASNSNSAERTLDAREIDGEPFDEIMRALESLTEDESLLLINSFEPVPLYTVLENRGFTYEPSQEAPVEWHVSISRQ